jgi:hypothetical protein
MFRRIEVVDDRLWNLVFGCLSTQPKAVDILEMNIRGALFADLALKSRRFLTP